MAEVQKTYADDDEDEVVSKSGEPLTEEEVQSIVQRMVEDAQEFVESELSPRRAEASKYYKGEPFGNEEKGRSKIIMTEVRDTISAILPSLMRVFWGPERPVEYRPEQPEDVEGAEQATDYVSKIVLQHDNNGFLVFHSWFKDALLKRLGIVKWYWESNDTVTHHRVEGVTEQDLEILLSDEEVSVSHAAPMGQSPDGILFSVDFRRLDRNGRAVIVALPPEEFIYNRDARTLADAMIVAHRTMKTRSELIAMGIEEEDIDEHGGKSTTLENNEEELARRMHSAQVPLGEAPDEASERIQYIEAFPYLDADGDGVAELRRVCLLGAGYYVVMNEPVSERPFAILCPDPEPHTIEGHSVADRTMDLQLLKSNLMRSTLDSLSQSIFTRMAVVEGAVSMEDVLNTEIGAPIRQTAPGMIQPLVTPFVGKEAFPMLEYLDAMKESRVGIAKGAGGLNADALQSSTKMAVAATVAAAQTQLEMIARVFAETGVRDLFRGLLRLLATHQPRARLVRMRNQWVPVDPRAWNTEMDVSVNIALGAGLIEDKIQTLMQVVAKQEQILQLLGPQNPLVNLAQYRHSMARILELSGIPDVDSYFLQVDPNWQPPQQQQEQQPDPAMLVAQAEIQKAQAEIQKKQADVQMKQVELQQQMEIEQQKLLLQSERDRMADDRERDRVEIDMFLRKAEIEAKYQTQIQMEEIKAAIEREREAAKLALAQRPKVRVVTTRDAEGRLVVEEQEVTGGGQ